MQQYFLPPTLATTLISPRPQARIFAFVPKTTLEFVTTVYISNSDLLNVAGHDAPKSAIHEDDPYE